MKTRPLDVIDSEYVSLVNSVFGNRTMFVLSNVNPQDIATQIFQWKMERCGQSKIDVPAIAQLSLTVQSWRDKLQEREPSLFKSNGSITASKTHEITNFPTFSSQNGENKDNHLLHTTKRRETIDLSILDSDTDSSDDDEVIIIEPKKSLCPLRNESPVIPFASSQDFGLSGPLTDRRRQDGLIPSTLTISPHAGAKDDVPVSVTPTPSNVSSLPQCNFNPLNTTQKEDTKLNQSKYRNDDADQCFQENNINPVIHGITHPQEEPCQLKITSLSDQSHLAGNVEERTDDDKIWKNRDSSQSDQEVITVSPPLSSKRKLNEPCSFSADSLEDVKRTCISKDTPCMILECKEKLLARHTFCHMHNLEDVLPLEICKFLGEKFWLFTIEQLSFVLSVPSDSDLSLRCERSAAECKIELRNALMQAENIISLPSVLDDVAVEEVLNDWKKMIENWNSSISTEMKLQGSQFSFHGSICCLTSPFILEFLVGNDIKTAKDLLSIKITEGSPLTILLDQWRQKNGMEKRKSASVRILTAVANRIQVALRCIPPPDFKTRCWMGSGFIALPKIAQDFVLDCCPLFTDDDFVSTRSTTLIDELHAWRRRKSMVSLHDSSVSAIISSWKCIVKDAKIANAQLSPSSKSQILKESLKKISHTISDNSISHSEQTKLTPNLEKLGMDTRKILTVADNTTSSVSCNLCMTDRAFLTSPASKDIGVDHHVQEVELERSPACSDVKESVSSLDPIFGLSESIRVFLRDRMSIISAEELLLSKSATVAIEFIKWRKERNMPTLKGNGAIASVSSWKGTVRDRAIKSNVDLSIVERLRRDETSENDYHTPEVYIQSNKDRVKSNEHETASSNSLENMLCSSIFDFCVGSVYTGYVYDFRLQTQVIDTIPETFLTYKGARKLKNEFFEESVTKKYCYVPNDVPILHEFSSDLGYALPHKKETLDCIFNLPFRGTIGVVDVSRYFMFEGSSNDSKELHELMTIIVEFLEPASNSKSQDIGADVNENDLDVPSKCTGPPRDTTNRSIQVTPAPNRYSHSPSKNPDDVRTLHIVDNNKLRRTVVSVSRPIERGQSVRLVDTPRLGMEYSFGNQQLPQGCHWSRHVEHRRAIGIAISSLSMKQIQSIITRIEVYFQMWSAQAANLDELYHDMCWKNPAPDLQMIQKMFIKRRRYHFIASRLLCRLSILSKESSVSTDDYCVDMKKLMSTVSDMVWDPFQSKHENLLSQLQDNIIFKCIQEEVLIEIRTSLAERGLSMIQFDTRALCRISAALLRGILDDVSAYLLSNTSEDAVGQSVLFDSLIHRAVTASNILNETCKSSTNSSIRKNLSLFCCEEDEHFHQEVSCYIMIRRNVKQNKRAFPINLNSFCDGEEDFVSVRNFECQEHTVHMSWYLINQIVFQVHNIATSGIVCWHKDKYSFQKLFQSVLAVAGEKTDTFLNIDKASMILPNVTANKFVNSEWNINQRSSYYPRALPIFFQTVWPVLREYGCYINGGDDISDSCFITPVYTSDRFVGPVSSKAEHRRTTISQQFSEANLLLMPRCLHIILMKSMKRQSHSVSSNVSKSCSVNDAINRHTTYLLNRLSADHSKRKIELMGDAFKIFFQDIIYHVLFPNEIQFFLSDGTTSCNRMCDLLTCDYLLRVLLMLPDTLTEAGAENYEPVLRYASDLMEYLSLHHLSIFPDEYHPQDEQYTTCKSNNLASFESLFKSSSIQQHDRHELTPGTNRSTSDYRSKIDLKQQLFDEHWIHSFDVSVVGETVHTSEEDLVTDYTVLSMRSSLLCCASREVCIGRKTIHAGEGYLVCRHCVFSGEGKIRCYFFENIESLHKFPNIHSEHVLTYHSQSPDITKKLCVSRDVHVQQLSSKTRSQSNYFAKLWQRLKKKTGENDLTTTDIQDNHTGATVDCNLDHNRSLCRSPSESLHTAVTSQLSTVENHEGQVVRHEHKSFKTHVEVMEFICDSAEWKRHNDVVRQCQNYYLKLENSCRGLPRSTSHIEQLNIDT